MSKHPYDMTTPCPECPFRSNRAMYLRAERFEELRQAEGEFHCHKTTEYDEKTDETYATSKTKVCAGFLIIREHSGEINQLMRIAERLGLYAPGDLDMDADVYNDWDELIEAAEAATP